MPDKGRLLTIGQAVEYLRRDWPDVSPSKLRYWEKEGLLQPRRSPGGHRLYCPADLRRLRLLLGLRSRGYLPVRQVRRALQAAVEDTARELTLVERFVGPCTYGQDLEPSDLAGVARQLGVSVEILERLRRAGIVQPGCRSGQLEGDELQIAAVAADLLELGIKEQELAVYVRLADRLAAHDERIMRRLTEPAGGRAGPQGQGGAPPRGPGQGAPRPGEGEALTACARFRERAAALVRLLYLRAVRVRLAEILKGVSRAAAGMASRVPATGSQDPHEPGGAS